MAAPILTYLGGTTDSFGADIYGGLPSGYFVALPDTDQITLYQVDAPLVAIGSAATENSQFDSAQNIAGDLYMTAYYDASTSYLAQISNTGSTLTVGTAGTFTQVPSRIRWLSLSYDGTEVAIWNQTDTKFLVLSTADASVIADTTLTGHTATWIVAAAGSGRVVGTDSVAQAFKMFDGPTDTLLDTYSWPSTMGGGNPKYVLPIGTDRLFFAMLMNDSADPQNYWIGVLSTAGDTLSLEWSDTLATNWASGGVAQAVVAVGDGFAIVGPSITLSGAASLYSIDTSTGNVRATDASTDVGTGVRQANCFVTAGSGYLVYEDTSSPYTRRVWSITSARPSTLRQRQSPRRSPSRVGYPALRQRQSPFIR